MSEDDPQELLEDLKAGEDRAIARIISIIVDKRDGHRALLQALYRADRPSARTVGITGSPGVGKSTLVNELIATYREADLDVAVLAVDPDSPITGGAILGDRIRFEAAVGDDRVFVRSISTRGSQGGLTNATASVLTVLEVAGFDRILLETVGVGQGEVAVGELADTVVVVTQPASGDDIQLLKAGILEIADIFVVNKADLDSVDETVRGLQRMLELQSGTNTARNEGWEPSIIETIAKNGQGIDRVERALEEHHSAMTQTGEHLRRRLARHRKELEALLEERLHRYLEASLGREDRIEAAAERLRNEESDPYTERDRLLDVLERCSPREADHSSD